MIENVLNIFSNPVNFLINFVVTVIINVIVLYILLKILEMHSYEYVNLINLVKLVVVINTINMFGIISILSFFFPSFIMSGFVISIVIWFLLTKLFLHDISFFHALIFSIIGFSISMFIIPYIVFIILALIPF